MAEIIGILFSALTISKEQLGTVNRAANVSRIEKKWNLDYQ